MSVIREVHLTEPAQPTLEGAGVSLHRAFGHGQHELFDPFLMLDDFRNTDPARFVAGFPWHPHRGIETITYVITGEVDHADSLGNAGTIGAGDVQWMTAGSGIVHQEMPRGDARGHMGGFQLWANLPAREKMTDPRYRGVEAPEIPVVSAGGATVRIICGTVGDVTGPVGDIVIEPEYLDVTLESGVTWEHPTTPGHTVFAYLFAGAAQFGTAARTTFAGSGMVVLLADGDTLRARAEGEGARFLLVSGKPLREPVAWGGPIVMNTRQELREAFAELDAGTFIKHAAAGA